MGCSAARDIPFYHIVAYVIDGFLISPNVTVESVQTVDEGFENSDHNPVLLTVSLGE